MKYLVFDSSSLINMTTNGLSNLLEKLKAGFKGEFLITKSVKYETMDHPLQIERFEWGALRIKNLLDNKTLKMAEDIFDEKIIKQKAGEILNQANNTFFKENQAIHLIEAGEAETLAVSLLLTQKGLENLAVIDERTARMLSENTSRLRELLENKLHTGIRNNSNKLEIEKVKIIRSTELAYLAYKKGLVEIKDKKALEAMLYALKFGGCSITEKEILSISKI
jgi:hypothetical protein